MKHSSLGFIQTIYLGMSLYADGFHTRVWSHCILVGLEKNKNISWQCIKDICVNLTLMKPKTYIKMLMNISRWNSFDTKYTSDFSEI